MATYVNNLRLKEIATGDESGTWGTSTNTNLELIGEALGYNTQDCFASDANATTTVADGATDPARALYFKVTSSATLTATRTLTIAPNTVSRVMFIENATTGSQSIEISQGSGANVTIPTGEAKVVYLDGAGSGAAVVDALNLVDVGDGTVTSVGGTGTVNGITLTGTVTSSGNLTLGGTLANVDLTSQITGTLPVANGGTGATSLTANNVLLGNGASAVQVVAPGSSGNVLTSNGTTWESVAPATSVTVSQISDYTGDATTLNYTSNLTSDAQTQLNAKATYPSQTGNSGKFLTTDGSAASWDAVDVSSEITGTLPVANGGTGATTLTANSVLLGNGTSAPLTVAPSTSGNVLTSNGTTWQSVAPAGGGFSAMSVITSTSTFTIPAGVTTLKVTVVGGGGGGAYGQAASGSDGGNTTVASGTETISTITGGGGARAPGTSPTVGPGGVGGTGSGGDLNFYGSDGGGQGGNLYGNESGKGGSSFFGGGGYNEVRGAQPGGAGHNYGGGGGGTSSGGGGGGGGTAIKYLTGVTPGNTLAVTIGAGGNGGNGGPAQAGAGASGVVVFEY